MAEKDSTRQEEPQTIELLESEWDEIESSMMALHASMQFGVEDEGLTLLETVYSRLTRAVQAVRTRIDSDQLQQYARNPDALAKEMAEFIRDYALSKRPTH